MRAKIILGWIGFTVLCMSAVSHASDAEYEVKAALLYKAFTFIHWPESAFTAPGAPLGVCILGDDPFGPAIDMLSGLTIHGRAVEIKRLAALDTVDSQCHVLFIAASEAKRLNMIFAAVKNKPILTVAEISSFARRGGIMNFASRYNRVRFEINADMSRRAGLNISSQFMRMVTVVDSDDGANP